MNQPLGMAKLLCMLMLAALAGCSSLPRDVVRPASSALTDVADTPLAQAARAATPDDKRSLSGFRLLPVGDHAFDTRVTLARRAQKSLDVQYYLIAQDDIGMHFL